MNPGEQESISPEGSESVPAGVVARRKTTQLIQMSAAGLALVLSGWAVLRLPEAEAPSPRLGTEASTDAEPLFPPEPYWKPGDHQRSVSNDKALGASKESTPEPKVLREPVATGFGLPFLEELQSRADTFLTDRPDLKGLVNGIARAMTECDPTVLAPPLAEFELGDHKSGGLLKVEASRSDERDAVLVTLSSGMELPLKRRGDYASLSVLSLWILAPRDGRPARIEAHVHFSPVLGDDRIGRPIHTGYALIEVVAGEGERLVPYRSVPARDRGGDEPGYASTLEMDYGLVVAERPDVSGILNRARELFAW